ncbi:MAG: DDE-type integrase/transposase/recombinase [Bacteroidia bacterium]
MLYIWGFKIDTFTTVLLKEKRTRRSIHTGLKILLKQNAVPSHLLDTLSPSQIWKYKNEGADKYYGNELFEYATNAEQLLKQYSKHSIDRKVINGYIRLAVILRNAFSSLKKFNKTLYNCKAELADVTERLSGKQKPSFIAKLIGVSRQTLRSWLLEERAQCVESPIQVCKKKQPSQLTSREIQQIKTMLTDTAFKFWPLCSVYYHALHTNLLSFGLSTFYKYVRLLNIKRLKPLSAKVYGEGLRASRPDEYWHADVIHFRTKDGIKNYIYVVIDNYSKKLLSLFASAQLSGERCKESIQSAATNTQQIYASQANVSLITDGGSENVNQTVDEFLSEHEPFSIERFIALKQIRFSNSMVEAVNKIIRNTYLNHFDVENLTHLKKLLVFVKEDYNHRPHGALKGLRPEIAYKGVPVDLSVYSERIRDMKVERRKINRKDTCNDCKWK